MKALAGTAALLLAGCVAAPERPSPPQPASSPEPPRVAAPRPSTPVPVLLDEPEQGALVRGQAVGRDLTMTLDGRPVPIAPDGRFVIGFDRDAPPTATLLLTAADGGRFERRLTVRPGAWRIERVDAPYRAGRTDAEFAAARPAELAQIAAARARVMDAAGWRQRFRWPATGRQSGWFGAQRVYRGQAGGYHSGADVAVPTGTPVTAPADGVVILATERPFTLEGRLLMIDHGHGLSSALLHLSRIDVPVGARVRQGQVIGLSGATGRVSGPHLHWGLQWRGAKLDPLKVAGPVPPGG